MTITKLTAIDLFSGSGGLSYGFTVNGFNVLQAIEIEKETVATYKNNFKNVLVINNDIRKIDSQECLFQSGLKQGELTVLIGGPPCRGFSESNKRTRTLYNPSNHLYKEYLRFLKLFLPNWFLFENVIGLKTLDNGSVINEISRIAVDLGYAIRWEVVNSADYGVPQFRKRIIMVGRRDGSIKNFPQKTNGVGLLPYITVGDAISDLPNLDNGASIDQLPYPDINQPLSTYQIYMRKKNTNSLIQGNLVTKNCQEIINRYNHIKPGENWEAIPKELLGNYKDPSRCHSSIYYRLDNNSPAKVLGNFRKLMIIHPQKNRGLSIREAARLQSFPDDFEFSGSIGYQQQQVADAVPPLLSSVFAKWIKSQI